ncbi:MAG: YbfB/YjiJ family MFS transporter [Gammaproteobacteria bacterium]|nr:YbfB/YjiJ family MFS transporter [Gammaproteobacteria bacterium]
MSGLFAHLLARVRRQPAVVAGATPYLWTLIMLSAARVLAAGTARFAYKQLLPVLQSDVHWSVVQAGALYSAFAAGCLIGTMLTPQLEKVFGTKQCVVGSLLVTGVAFAAILLLQNFPGILMLWFLTSLANGPLFICGSHWVIKAGYSVRTPNTRYKNCRCL